MFFSQAILYVYDLKFERNGQKFDTRKIKFDTTDIGYVDTILEKYFSKTDNQ